MSKQLWRVWNPQVETAERGRFVSTEYGPEGAAEEFAETDRVGCAQRIYDSPVTLHVRAHHNPSDYGPVYRVNVRAAYSVTYCGALQEESAA